MSDPGARPSYVFMGTSPFAVEVLAKLVEADHRPELVITPPDRGSGRGRKLSPPPVAERANELGLDLHQTKSVNQDDSVAAIRATDASAGVVCAFGQLIGEPLLTELELLNVHPSLLPRWRGAAPLERTIMARDARTGVCIIQLTEGLDSGPVAIRRETPLGDEETFGELAPRLAALGGELMVVALDRLGAGELSYEPQPEKGVTYAEKIIAADRDLDPSQTAAELAATVRALHPHIGARLQLDPETTCKIGAAEAIFAEAEVGTLGSEEDRLTLGCAEGSLAISRLQPPGKRMMDAAEWLRGNELPDCVPQPQ